MNQITEEEAAQERAERAHAASEAARAEADRVRDRGVIADAARSLMNDRRSVAAVVVGAEQWDVDDDAGGVRQGVDVTVTAEFLVGERVSPDEMSAIADGLEGVKAVALTRLGGLYLGGTLVFRRHCHGAAFTETVR